MLDRQTKKLGELRTLTSGLQTLTSSGALDFPRIFEVSFLTEYQFFSIIKKNL